MGMKIWVKQAANTGVLAGLLCLILDFGKKAIRFPLTNITLVHLWIMAVAFGAYPLLEMQRYRNVPAYGLCVLKVKSQRN
jgi:hypothetical protein